MCSSDYNPTVNDRLCNNTPKGARVITMSIYKDDVSDEPLEIIRINECEYGHLSVHLTRFRRLWNEIEKGRQLARMVANGNFNQADVIKLARELIE